MHIPKLLVLSTKILSVDIGRWGCSATEPNVFLENTECLPAPNPQTFSPVVQDDMRTKMTGSMFASLSLLACRLRIHQLFSDSSDEECDRTMDDTYNKVGFQLWGCISHGGPSFPSMVRPYSSQIHTYIM